MKTIRLTVNGKLVSAGVEPRTHLADFLRETLNLTGTHLGCEHGVCGACTLLIDGMPARSCITLAVACDGASITTIEGQDDDELMVALRAAFHREHALQCGYCTPGMLVAARDTVLRLPDASEHEIRVAMSGNLCRCTGYAGIVRAIQGVLAERKAQGAPSHGAPRTGLGPAGSGHALPPAATSLHTLRTSRPAALACAAADHSGAPGAPQTTLHQSFGVDYRLDAVWDFFGNPGAVTACLPGASLIGEPTQNHVNATIRIKVGPIVADFEGSAEMVRDPSAHSGIIRGSARDARSSSATRGEIRYTLTEERGGTATRIDMEVGFTLTGPLAQFSRSGIVEDIAKRLSAAFARNLEARLKGGAAGTGPVASAPVPQLDAGSLFASVLWARIKAFLRRLVGG